MAPLRSSGRPMRPMGVSDSHFSRSAGLASRMFFVNAVCRPQSRRQAATTDEHISGRERVDADARLSPLDGERGGHLPDGRFTASGQIEAPTSVDRPAVVRRLRLRHVDDGAGHGADEDDRAGLGLGGEHMPRRFPGAEEGALDVDLEDHAHLVCRVLERRVAATDQPRSASRNGRTCVRCRRSRRARLCGRTCRRSVASCA